MNRTASADDTHTTFAVLIIGILIAGSLWTLLPFLGGLIWATAILVATWLPIIGGVGGGLIGFCVIGLFVGPVILAVSYTLIQSWTSDEMTLREA